MIWLKGILAMTSRRNKSDFNVIWLKGYYEFLTVRCLITLNSSRSSKLGWLSRIKCKDSRFSCAIGHEKCSWIAAVHVHNEEHFRAAKKIMVHKNNIIDWSIQCCNRNFPGRLRKRSCYAVLTLINLLDNIFLILIIPHVVPRERSANVAVSGMMMHVSMTFINDIQTWLQSISDSMLIAMH